MQNSDKFLNALKSQHPTIEVLETEEATKKYGNNSLNAKRKISGAIFASTESQVLEIVQLANQFKVTLYPVSRGHNWGYGSATPVVDNCWVISLHKMNRIIDFDERAGIVTVEPGVTPQQLWEFLHDNNYHWLVPVTGAGLSGSLIGNALDCGFGIVPISSHVSAMTGYKIIMGSGETFCSLHGHLTPNRRIDKYYPWDLGPNIQALFAQSNFGIVTEASITLKKIPESISFCSIKVGNQFLQEAIPFIQNLSLTFPGSLGYISLINKQRVKNMQPSINEKRLSDWTILIVIYGNKEVTRSIYKYIKSTSSHFALSCQFLSEKTWNKLKKYKLSRYFLKSILGLDSEYISNLFDFFKGKPTNDFVAGMLSLKQDELLTDELDIESMNKGIFWFAPLIPHNAEDVKQFIQMTKQLIESYHFTYSITLTSFGGYCFDATIPIIYDKSDEEQQKLANSCFEALFALCLKNEYIPYRIGINLMDKLMIPGNSHYQLVHEIKKIMDPNQVISPGRYHY